MKTGIVFALENGKATLLKPNGEFVTVRASRDWQKGDVVRFSQPYFSAKQFCTMAACLALVMAGLWGGNLYFTPVALVSMDVNPSVELKLNRFDKVVAIKALNEDGEAIVLASPVVYQDYAQAVSTLLREDSGFAPYLQNNPAVVFAVYTKDMDKEASLTKGLKNTAENLIVDNAPIEVECHAIDAGLVESAHHYGVSPGKYLYLAQLIEADPSLRIADYTHHTISQIKDQIDECASHDGDQAGERAIPHHDHE